ncbi:MAG: peptidylprolyl isomerase [Oscillospiraceae bacterium]
MRIKNIIMCAALAVSCLVGITGCQSVSGNSSGNSVDNSGDNSGGNTVSAAGDGKSGGNIDEVVLKEGDKIAVIEIEGYGTIKAKLYPDAAPVGVDNFIKLAEAGYYDGLKIHRVISDFMLQGGSLNGDGFGGEAAVNGGSFGIEPNKSMRHFYGALCYANAMGNNSTQFYIVNNKTPQDISELNTEYFKSNADAFDAYAEQMKGVSDDYAQYYAFQAKYYRTVAEWAESASDEVKAKYAEVGGTPSLDGNYTVFGQVYEGFDVIDAVSAVEVEDNGSGEQSAPVSDIIISKVYVTDYAEG